MRWAGVASFVVLWGLLQSCGGRVLETDGPPDASGSSGATGGLDAGRGARDGRGASDGGDDEPPRGTGGSVPGTGGTIGTGGSAVATGGTFGVGGASACGPCREIGCLEGWVPAAPEPGSCCSMSCVLDCSRVGCSDIDLDCQPGFHVGTLPEECCPQCVPDAPQACEQARTAYDNLRKSMILKYQALGCATDGDCLTFGESNRCRSTCGTPISRAGRDLIEENLYNFAADNCTQCPQPQPQPCPASPPLVCVANSCQFRGIPQ